MTSCTSVDLPDPLTPVTHVSAPSGNDTSTFFRLCAVAPVTRTRWPVPRRRSAGTGIVSSARRYLAVSDRVSRLSPSSEPS